MPLALFPFFLSSLADALVAIGRIQKFLTAEELAEPHSVDYHMKYAVTVDGDFTWETAGKLESKFDTGAQNGGKKSKGRKANGKAEEGPVLPMSVRTVQSGGEEKEKEEEEPFELKNLKLSVPKGAFVAIVGRVGSGKVFF